MFYPNTTYTVKVPEVNLINIDENDTVDFVEWLGMISIDEIQILQICYRKYNSLTRKPWISVYVQGFSDSPVAWDVEEHHYYCNGDNGYIILFNDTNYLLCTKKCSKKCYK
ncbi:hypothetical protein NQ314_019916 [Rhamnusium bicolor]|uniref:Uncharacterized protein n=1 Tax=Rhamnusium bicolor TaxID=1586634 RepID=A0AAV8WM40_9CUCU|nr:hypothetical protein NQ314_019916 [Rhamnusium bicolor]